MILTQGFHNESATVREMLVRIADDPPYSYGYGAESN
jgi:hypothetical protein